MAIDSRDKRGSALQCADPVTHTLPDADAAVSKPDRQYVVGEYMGITADTPPGVISDAWMPAYPSGWTRHVTMVPSGSEPGRFRG